MKIVGIDALVVLGGEGTLTIAAEFDKRGVPVCGVPKTIDNDLACTELTFGFVTALDIATEALDRLHTTAESHDRVMILEVMGRHAGWIALHSSRRRFARAMPVDRISALSWWRKARRRSGTSWFIKTRVMENVHLVSVASANTCNRILNKLPDVRRVAWCLDISSAVAGQMHSTACWRLILARVQCGPWLVETAV
jgi:hypothetical protein